MVVSAAWWALAAVHLPPAAPLVRPGALARLYGVSSGDAARVLLIHRAALFLAISGLCAAAAVDPAVRRVVSVAVSMSVLGFLALYAQAGAPAGPLRTIAAVDAAATAPLALAVADAWSR